MVWQKAHLNHPTNGRPIHLGIDEATGDIVACAVTDSGTHGKEELPEILEQVEDPITLVFTDGA